MHGALQVFKEDAASPGRYQLVAELQDRPSGQASFTRHLTRKWHTFQSMHFLKPLSHASEDYLRQVCAHAGDDLDIFFEDSDAQEGEQSGLLSGARSAVSGFARFLGALSK